MNERDHSVDPMRYATEEESGDREEEGHGNSFLASHSVV